LLFFKKSTLTLLHHIKSSQKNQDFIEKNAKKNFFKKRRLTFDLGQKTQL